mgnify:CR=1 FL=1
MKRKYKLPPVKRITICGSKAVMEALQQKAYSHEKTLSAFLREAGLAYNPEVKDGGKIINVEEIK